MTSRHLSPSGWPAWSARARPLLGLRCLRRPLRAPAPTAYVSCGHSTLKIHRPSPGLAERSPRVTKRSHRRPPSTLRVT
eukprot:6148116-Pyramimonas_sp.AAC.1